MFATAPTLFLSLSLSPGDGSRSPASQKEFVELCRVVNNASPLFPGNFATALELFDMCVSVVPIFACARASPWLPPRPHRRPTRPRVALASNDDGLIDFSEFQELDRRYPLVLFPAFRLQDRMQKMTLGEEGWKRIMKDVTKAKRIQDYKSAHGGQLPPQSRSEKFYAKNCSCFIRERKVNIERIEANRPGAVMRKEEARMKELTRRDDKADEAGA